MAKSIIFITPKDSKRILDGSGWSFYSSGVVSDLVSIRIISFFNVKLEEEFLGIKKYQNEYTQVNVVYSKKKIKEIYIRTSLQKNVFVNQLSDLLKDDEVDIFVPSELVV